MGSDWRKKVTNHWIKVEMLLAGRGDSCIAHILYSPKAKTGWSLEQLKRVAQALSYFETAFLANLAPSIHMRNKFNSEEPSDSLLEQRRERIEACAKMDDLVIEMQSQKEKRFLYGWRSENANKDGTIGASHCS